MKFYKRITSVMCICVMFFVMLTTASCTQKNTQPTNKPSQSSEKTVLGEGETCFTLTVVDADAKETVFDILTDKKTVGEALSVLGIISGEEGPFGLYIKTVNSVTYDYDKDGKYWAFYVNGDYATEGVDRTEIKKGDTYMLKVE